MFWVTIGWLMVVVGTAGAILLARRARRRPTSGADGLAIGCGGGVALWGGIVVIVATILRGP